MQIGTTEENAMPRNTSQTADVDTAPETDEVDETAETPEGTEAAPKEAKAKKEPARGDLPEGYVTPVGLAKILSEKGLQKDRAGEVVKEVKPQMVYSYIKNAPKDDAFPIETIKDSLDKDRQVVKLDTALEWWERKNKRTEERKTNAAQKAEAKEKRASEKATATEEAGAEAEAEVVEAE